MGPGGIAGFLGAVFGMDPRLDARVEFLGCILGLTTSFLSVEMGSQGG